jgi:hypothetical protein
LNAIEHLWRYIKHEEMPVRCFSEADALKTAVDTVLDEHAVQIAQSTTSLCQAAWRNRKVDGSGPRCAFRWVLRHDVLAGYHEGYVAPSASR